MLTLLVGLPGAYVARPLPTSAGSNVVRAAVTVPFVLPTVVVGLGVPRAARAARAARAVDLRRTVAGHPARARLLQLRRGGAHRRRAVAHLDPRLEDAARVLGAGRWQAFREVTLPAAAPRDRRRRRDRVPLHVHVVRGRADPRRPGPRDARGRDLPRDHAAADLPLAAGAGAAAARRRGRRARRSTAGCSGGCRAAAGGRRRGRAATADGRCARVPRGQPAVHAGAGGRAARSCCVERSFAVGDGYGLAAWRALLGERRRDAARRSTGRPRCAAHSCWAPVAALLARGRRGPRRDGRRRWAAAGGVRAGRPRC